jgi:hypothetical protein
MKEQARKEGFLIPDWIAGRSRELLTYPIAGIGNATKTVLTMHGVSPGE